MDLSLLEYTEAEIFISSRKDKIKRKRVRHELQKDLFDKILLKVLINSDLDHCFKKGLFKHLHCSFHPTE